MWIIILSIFVLARGEIKCGKDIFEQCQKPTLFYEIPRDAEVFKERCPTLASYSECLRDYDMKCQKEEYRIFEKPDTYTKLIALFNDICDEGSALNEVVTSNLKCFNETFSNTNCNQEMSAFLKIYEKEESLDGFSITVIPYRVHCLSKIRLAGCVLDDINRNCGIRARQATVEFLQRSEFVDLSCSLRHRTGLLEDIDEFNLTDEEKTFAISELERMKISDEA